ncbi:hypothetical protein PUW24_00505 (plasmid) [Paenibacillus urinalis]|uniref:Uncharacterized protein n=1 Tax=Paenibacillus urinalis TaxID=521520 RepID=A0AAX3N983_9BACL|nr:MULTISPECIES: hypothetical protein [Paenibacillus]MCM3131098.1 hypothetical protein [Paenibacillus sp. MER 78]WDH85320.1 hypothetical protein PUW23_26145 [Paenibacillus urinalis]WDH95252.1 hypothetical protein PUW24_00505 [Paenibacillus urinalis]WDI05283.1 hypothetical protein PUW25_27060 [Paenibacillus urinalis]
MSIRFMKPLKSDIQLHTAKLDQEPILVFNSYELVGSGSIEEITEYSVKVRGNRYFKGVHTFKYAQ